MDTAALSRSFPSVPSLALDTLWLQVAGTLCNLECAHCFIASSPRNHSHPMLTLDDVRARLREAAALGVREYYFTGGEPFLHPEIFEMIEDALRQGPVHVLTNGLPLNDERCRRLRALSDASDYSLEVRLSLDGRDAATNDAVRGAGTFDRIVAAALRLQAAGLNPVLTVSEACEGAGTADGRRHFLAFLRESGLTRPRLKVLSLFRLGAEERRERPYTEAETLAGVVPTREALEGLQCATGRMVTSRGVYVCPILIEADDARMGDTLADTLRPFPLRHGACWTCHTFGTTCRT